MKTRMAAFLTVAWLAAAFPANPTCAEEDEVSFARGLLERGWIDRAEERFRELEESGESDAARSAGRLGLIHVLRIRAENEPDPARKKELFDEAIARYRAYLEAGADDEARFPLAGLLEAKGRDFARRMETASGEERETIRREADQAFAEAEDLVAGVVEAARDRGEFDDIYALPQARADRLASVFFRRGELRFLRASIAADETSRLERLREAEALFEEVVWEFEGMALAYAALVMRGRCASARGDAGRALDDFQFVLDLELPADASPAQRRQLRRLHVMAHRWTIAALVRAGRNEEALEAANDLERGIPDGLEPGADGREDYAEALLEKAAALHGRGRHPEAAAECLRLVEASVHAAAKALALLAGWGADGRVEAAPETLLRLAEAFLQSGRFFEAIEAGRRAVESMEGVFDPRSDPWGLLGRAYEARGQYYAASLAWEEGERLARRALRQGRSAGGDATAAEGLRRDAAECAYGAYRNARAAWLEGSRNGENQAPLLGDRLVEARERLTSRYGDSPWARGLHYFAGADHLRRGEPIAAAEAFERVPAESENFLNARLGLAKACLLAWRETGAAAHLERGIDAIETVLERAADAEPAMRYTLALLLVERKGWERIPAVLEDFETRFSVERDLAASSAYLRLRAFCELGRFSETERMLEILETHGEEGDGRLLLEGFLLVGKLFWNAAAEAGPECEQARKGALYLWRWAEGTLLRRAGEGGMDARDAASLETVGSRLGEVGAFDLASRCLEAVLEKGRVHLKKEDAMRVTRALAQCKIALEDWEAAVPLLETLKETRTTQETSFLLGRALRERGDRRDVEGRRDEAIEDWRRAVDLLGTLRGADDDPAKRVWWEWRVQRWLALAALKEYKTVVLEIEGAKSQYTRMGGPDLEAKVLALQEACKEKR